MAANVHRPLADIHHPWDLEVSVSSLEVYIPPPPKINKSLEKGPFEKDISSSNHHFSRGILFLDDSLKKKKQNKSLGSYLDPPDFV